MIEALDIDELTGPAAPVEHCGKPMRFLDASIKREQVWDDDFQLTASGWACECGATLSVIVRVPS